MPVKETRYAHHKETHKPGLSLPPRLCQNPPPSTLKVLVRLDRRLPPKRTELALEQPVKCAVCEQNIVDGKGQALFCEGQCQRWSHRYCAGVSLAHFDAFSSSSEPLYCIGCFQKCCNGKLTTLRDTISNLREEVTHFYKALEEMSKKNCSCTQSSHDQSAKPGVKFRKVPMGGRGRGRRDRGLSGEQVRNGIGFGKRLRWVTEMGW